jgi:myo-inositol-1(or 4)-monophosphatase
MTLPEQISRDLNQFIRELAHQSGELILPYYADHTLIVDQKSNQTPFTIADREGERIMREMIEKRFPHHGVIGEEFGSYQEDAEFVWTLDPIDGTISFTHACPLFGTLIGLLYQGKAILGAIHQPVLKQLVIGDGSTTLFNEKKVYVRETATLAEASLFTTDVDTIARARGIAGFNQLRTKTKLFRTWGDCYGYLLLASGFADIMLDGMMNPWDLIPLIPIIEGAGGIITAWDGGDVLKADSAVAASKALHNQVINILNN